MFSWFWNDYPHFVFIVYNWYQVCEVVDAFKFKFIYCKILQIMLVCVGDRFMNYVSFSLFLNPIFLSSFSNANNTSLKAAMLQTIKHKFVWIYKQRFLSLQFLAEACLVLDWIMLRIASPCHTPFDTFKRHAAFATRILQVHLMSALLFFLVYHNILRLKIFNFYLWSQKLCLKSINRLWRSVFNIFPCLSSSLIFNIGICIWYKWLERYSSSHTYIKL